MRQSALRWPAGYSGGKLSRSWIQSHAFDLQGFCKELPKPGRAHLVAHLYFVYARPFFVPRSNCYQGFRRFFLVVLLSPYNWVQRLSQFADTFLEVSAVLFFFDMLRIQRIRLMCVLPILGAMLICGRAWAQDDPNETPLGDVARNLRKKAPPAQPVIDDDNLPEAMQRAESRRGFGSSLRFLMAGESKGFQVSAPDVTCSLSFTANVKSLLSKQYAEMELPAGDLAKLEGQATIEGDALTVPVFNATDWHVSELAIAVTVIRNSRKTSLAGESLIGSTMAGEAADAKPSIAEDSLLEIRPEKKPDVTMLYRVRAAAAPGERTVFSAALGFDLDPTDEWHWAIVLAKGYPPQNYSGTAPQFSAASGLPVVPKRTPIPVSTSPQMVPAITPLANPQQ